MKKIIKYGFSPIVNDLIQGQNNPKGQKLFELGYVRNVVETEDQNNPVSITGTVLAQTSSSNIYSVKIILDKNRHVTYATCTCKPGLSKKCIHICAVVYYINSPDEPEDSNTSQSQGGDEPLHNLLLEYPEGIEVSTLFPPPKSYKVKNIVPLEVSTKSLGEACIGSPLYTVLLYQEERKKKIMAAESLVEINQRTKKRKLEEEAKKVASDDTCAPEI